VYEFVWLLLQQKVNFFSEKTAVLNILATGLPGLHLGLMQYSNYDRGYQTSYSC